MFVYIGEFGYGGICYFTICSGAEIFFAQSKPVQNHSLAEVSLSGMYLH